jgi:hypothetical protein
LPKAASILGLTAILLAGCQARYKEQVDAAVGGYVGRSIADVSIKLGPPNNDRRVR